MLHSISVVIPTRNRWQLLPRAIASVLNQTFDVAEIIVVDDGSDDVSSKDSIEKMSPKVRVVRHISPQGAPCARNTGWRIAESDFIAFLDDDDVWLPQKIEKQRAVFMASNRQVDLVFCGEALVKGSIIYRALPVKWDDASRKDMISRNVLGGTSTVIVRKCVLESSGGFDVTLPSCQDWDLFLRIAQSARIECVNEILVHRNIHENQISNALTNRLEGRRIFLEKHFNLIASIPEALAQHYRRMGCLLALDDRNNESAVFFKKALMTLPFNKNNWLCFLVNALSCGDMRKKILGMYAKSNLGGSEIYH